MAGGKAPPTQEQWDNYATLTPAEKARLAAVAKAVETDNSRYKRQNPEPREYYTDPASIEEALRRIDNGFGTEPGQWGEIAQPGGELSLGGGVPISDPSNNPPPSGPVNGSKTPPPGYYEGGPGGWGANPPTSGPIIGDPWTPSTPTTPEPINWDAFRPPLEGWEASDNKDFYQKQFQDLRTQKNVEGMAALAAAMRRQEAQSADPAPSDPWQWADLPQVVEGTGNPEDALNVEWGLNRNYGWDENTTNQQILADLNPIFSKSDQVYLNKHPDYFSSGPQFAKAGREATYEFLNNNPYPNDKGWTAVLNKLNNNIYQQLATAGTTPQGQTVPQGYASPTNL